MKEIIFLFVLFVANVIQAITGFAGTVLAMPPSIYLLGMDNAKVVLNVMALLSGLMIAVMSYHHMNKKEVLELKRRLKKDQAWQLVFRSVKQCHPSRYF